MVYARETISFRFETHGNSFFVSHQNSLLKSVNLIRILFHSFGAANTLLLWDNMPAAQEKYIPNTNIAFK